MFGDIAFSDHPVGSDEMIEFPPPSIKEKFFRSSSDAADYINHPSFNKNLVIFKDKLNLMREKYSPFLKNYVPEADILRNRLNLSEFKFRYKTKNDKDFKDILDGIGEWENVIIPDYRGPVGINGKWMGLYRTEFKFSVNDGKRLYLVFKGVDYAADIYINYKCIGSHEGFFAPFEFDITDVLKENNVLSVEIKNDYPTMGVRENPALDGDKIYAATGPGWDDPAEGWHHCPPGAGIYNKVYLEERSELYVKDVFVRSDIDNDSIEIWVDVFSSSDFLIQDFALNIKIYDRNIEGEKIIDKDFEVSLAGPGMNYYRYRIPFSGYRLWYTDNPWLYTVRVSILKNNTILDIKDRIFGMRKFHMDELSVPRGTLYLNNQKIFLRGANEMGHLQQCVMKEDYAQLIDDILIAKIANLNYYRITQRPVQEEIYNYFDMLGMMHQCDFPLFSTLRRNQFYEALRQVGEMERLIRSHPSSIMVTFINEPVAIRKHADPNHKFNKRYAQKAHRHLFRKELEDFFEAARKIISLENPDRVVKNVEGDYDPPSRTGLSDFHCYCMWYTNHAVPIGRLHKGHLPALKKEWKTGCGEYGTEGLDNFNIMHRYPKQWLTENKNGKWFPDRIVKSQTASMHGDWFEEKDNIADWIYESQKHQSLATRMMTDALRRRADVVVSTAVHLLIDAWPSGWMKALVGADRIPKPAYFELKKCLEPIRINLRCDRFKAYCGDIIKVEVWGLNDTPRRYEKCKIYATLRSDENLWESFEIDCDINPSASAYLGTVRVNIQGTDDRAELYLDACLVNSLGHKINDERLTFEIFKKFKPKTERKVAYIGLDACNILRKLGINGENFEYSNEVTLDAILISSMNDFSKQRDKIAGQIKKGANVVIIADNSVGAQFEIYGMEFALKHINPVYFVALDHEADITKHFKPDDFSYCYNAEADMMDFIADRYFDKINMKPLIYSYGKKTENGWKEKLPVVGSINLWSREVYFYCMPLKGRIGYNPVMDRLMLKLLGLL